MEPRIQYAKTSDGVSIAFWTLGMDRPGASSWFNLPGLYHREAATGRAAGG
jgi:hypothetical protein